MASFAQHKLRLSSRLAVATNGASVVVPAGSVDAVVSLFPNAPSFNITPAQWFKFYGLWLQMFGGLFGADLVTVKNPSIVVSANPPGSEIPIYVVQGPTNGVDLAQVAINLNESPLFSYIDYLQIIGSAYPAAGLDILATASNPGAIDHNVTVNLGAVVEIYDVWDEHMLGPERDVIGLGGPITGGYRRA